MMTEQELKALECEPFSVSDNAVLALITEIRRLRAELQIARNDRALMEHCANVREQSAYKAAWERARAASPFDTWQQAFKEWKER